MTNRNRKRIKKRKALKNQTIPDEPTIKPLSGKKKLILAIITVAVGVLLLWAGNKLMTSASLADISDIKVADSEFIDISDILPRGATKLYEIDKELYFVADTRAKDDSSYYALFKYNDKTESFSKISKEVGYINYIDGQFVYPKSHKKLDGSNELSVTYYANNAKWDDEKKLTKEETEDFIKKMTIRTAEIDGSKVDYIPSSPEADTIRIDIQGGRAFNVKLDFSDIFTKTIDGVTVGANSIVGISNGKLYFVGSYQIIDGEIRTSLFSIKLDSTELKMIDSTYATTEVGYEFFLGDDGNIYFQYAGKPSSHIMKLDSKTDNASLLAEVPGQLWGFVKNDDTILCSLDDDYDLNTPGGLQIIKY